MTTDQVMARQQREDEQKRITLCYKRVFAGSDGETVLEDLETVFGIWLPAFLPLPNNSRDAYSTAYAAIRDGQRQVWLHIRNRLRAKVQPDGNETDPRVIVKTGLSDNGL